MRCRIELVDDSGLRAGALPLVDRSRLQRIVDLALAEDDLADCLLTVRLVDDQESARLHNEHFSDPTTTDVMSFPDGTVDPESGLTHLGDLAVCVPVAERAANELTKPVGEELMLYVLHGLLHLLGYDDIDSGDREEMWQVQARIMGEVGIRISH